jgi:hypothetical protein
MKAGKLIVQVASVYLLSVLVARAIGQASKLQV